MTATCTECGLAYVLDLDEPDGPPCTDCNANHPPEGDPP